MQFYRIKDWQDLYENNRTRELKNMLWIPVPVKLSGDGYCMIMEDEKGRRKDGPAIFGTFISIIELAASCDPRGDLLKSDKTPHTFDSIGRICRIDPILISKTISFCVDILKWIEIITIDIDCGNTAQDCGITAAYPSLPSLPVIQGGVGGFEKSKHGKRSKIGYHLFKNCVYFDFEKFRTALPEWSIEKCRHYYEAAKYYSEQNNKEYAGWIATVKNWDRLDIERGRPFKNYEQKHIYEKL